MRRFWTDHERKLLSELYADNSTDFIAKKLNRSITSIYTQANIMKLHKSEEYMKIALQREAEKLKIVGIKNRFNKGHIPSNLGQKMSNELREKCKVTFFKDGHEPHNTKYDGYERLDPKDGYIQVRIKKGKFVLKHRYVWEQHNGPIPKGNIIIFIDCNKYNLNIDNLQMISMKENMERNRITKYPKELQELIKLNNKLKTTLHEKQD
jgi:hypothetical protein